MATTLKTCILNGQLIPLSQATISLANIEYSYGFGVYESVMVLRGKPIFAQEHCERLLESASAIELQHPFSTETMHAWLHTLIKQISQERYNCKMLLIGAKEAGDAQLAIIPLNPRFPAKKLYTYGAPVITYAYQRTIPNAKTLNMLGSYLAYREAQKQNCYEALLQDIEGNLREGTRTNFFVVSGGTILSPPNEKILEGITRKHILDIAAKEGIPVRYTDIPVQTLGEYDSAFLSSSTGKIMPVRKIGDIEYTEIPETTRRLMELYDALLKKQSPENRNA